jgi:hypothetical protein
MGREAACEASSSLLLDFAHAESVCPQLVCSRLARRVRSVATFVLRLISPRPNFAQTITDPEREIMSRHAAHWRPYLDRGEMVVFGPVLTDEDS